MIITHDSLTFDSPSNLLLNLISCFWRCQKLSIDEQYQLGVRVFDIRVSRKDDMWVGAHGIYKCKHISFKTLSELCKSFKIEFPNSYIRIYLEDKIKNNEELKKLFLDEAEEAYNKYESMIWEIGTHFPWITYYKNPNLPFKELKEYYCHLFNWNPDRGILYNLKNIDFSSWSIPLYAKKHNIPITQEMIDDTNTAYMFDYAGVYPKQ